MITAVFWKLTAVDEPTTNAVGDATRFEKTGPRFGGSWLAVLSLGA